ncbi:DASH family cryptochrome [Roseisolibacter sp. H3M3-2]|uniref:DASH family cryptochrome n=1 Tax=Roseisolibacter sp. H3M3-2 TaxID=3031323 RepID=UPI0023DAEC0A|nr:DASH family cryptochrome [Roseisolibacter sp. H3M3-2]MDF1503347.1 DASH family cryptochrome [Roseisolibacter sp. H3M3-2]
MSQSPPAALVWLRHDLRLHDHEPLVRAAAWAAEYGGRVVPVWCDDPRAQAPAPLSGRPPRLGPHRARFLAESLADLRASLRAVGADLVVRRGRPDEVLPALARETGAGLCAYHAECCPEEAADEAAVERALAPLEVACEGYWGHTLLHRDDLPFGPDDLPATFTEFRTRVDDGAGRGFRDGCAPRMLLPAPTRLPAVGVEPGALPTPATWGHAPAPRDPRARLTLGVGERAALARLEGWVFAMDRLARYKATRNGLTDPDDSSKLSPWLAHGCLSPRAVYGAVRSYEARRGATEQTHWLVFELLWRDYFRLAAARAGAALFRPDGPARVPVRWRRLDDPRHGAPARADFARWCAGETGFPLVDAAMRELRATGFTSNRTRQNVASFLTKNLGVDWRAGAWWFEAQLVDYDPASNWGNWAYAAGVGQDPRGFRYFDVDRQAAQYDPDGAYARQWLARDDFGRPRMVDLRESARANERRWAAAARGVLR